MPGNLDQSYIPVTDLLAYLINGNLRLVLDIGSICHSQFLFDYRLKLGVDILGQV
jgi:hypothetical protein